MEKVMNKLVRDKIPGIIEANKEKAIYHILDEQEYKNELKNKLEEEVLEVRKAQDKNEILEECADVLEVLRALVQTYGYTWDDLVEVNASKREKRGGFEKRIYLEKTKD